MIGKYIGLNNRYAGDLDRPARAIQKSIIRRLALAVCLDEARGNQSSAGPCRDYKIHSAVPTLSCFVSTILLSLLIWTPRQANAEMTQSARAFFKGKIVTVIIPYGAAGGYEYWAAALKPYLEKTLGVARIDLVNKAGGGGLVGANYLYQAKPDGLTIGEVNGSGAIFAQIIHKPAVNFDMTKFDWIGTPNVETTVTVARAGSPYKSFSNLWKLHGGTHKVVGLSAGYGGSNYVGTAVPLATFGIPYQMLLAYQGSSATKAGLLRGDGDVVTQGYSVFRPLIQSHSVVPLCIEGGKPFPLLPGIPTIVQLAKQYKLSQSKVDMINTFVGAVNMGKDWTAPPGVPDARLAFLRTAFRDAVQNKGFLSVTKKAGRLAGYSPPTEIERVVAGVIKKKAEFTPFLKR